MTQTEDMTYEKADLEIYFNDTNGRYDIRKSCLEIILMIQTEDTTYGKAAMEVILMIQTIDTTYEKAVWKSF